MSFFGITRLGDEELFKNAGARRAADSRSIQNVPLQDFLLAFQSKARDHSSPDGAAAASVSAGIPSSLIPQVLTFALCRPPTVAEMDLALRVFEVGPKNITIQDFNKGIQQMQRLNEVHLNNRGAASSTIIDATVSSEEQKKTSYTKLCEERQRHVVDSKGPMDLQDVALTANQDYGWWDSWRQHQMKREYFPRKRTDVTINEGVCLETYYKMF